MFAFTKRASLASMLLPLALAIGCPTGSSGDPEPGTDPDVTDGGEPDSGPGAEPSPGPGVEGDCPAGNGEGASVCMTQSTGDANYIGEDTEATLTEVTAVTGPFYISETLTGFYVADDPMVAYGGVLVTMLTEGAPTIVAGDIVDVVGTINEFGSQDAPGTETQFQSTSVTVVRSGTAPSPLSLDDLATLNDDGMAEPYEGLLVTIPNVQVTNPSLGFGQWEISDGVDTLVVDNDFYSYPALDGEVLGSITGMVRYSTFAPGQFIIVPRNADDVVSESRPTKGIAQLRNPLVDGYVAPCPDGQFSGCGQAVLANMVVITEPYYISGGDNGPLFGMIIADPAEVDGDGRLLPYSGIEMTISPEHPQYTPTITGFDFAQDSETYEWVNPDQVPAPGDVINLSGQNASYYGMPQFRFVSELTKVEGSEIAMPLPALFDGTVAEDAANYSGKLKGGRPDQSIAPAPEVDSFLAVYVELANVTTTNACYPSPYTPQGGTEFERDFGYYLVTGDVEIGDRFRTGFSGRFPEMTDAADQICANQMNRCGDNRAADQTFTALRGVVDISFDVYRVHPRSTDDIEGITLSTEMCE